MRSAAVLAAVLVGSGIILIWRSPEASVASYAEVRTHYTTSEQWVADRQGEPIGQVRADPNGRRLGWLKLQEISPAMTEMVIQAEDKRFFSHHGIDWRAFAASSVASALAQLHGRTGRGGSTLSMQLAALISSKPELRSGHRTLTGKLQQMRLASALERSWTKQQILEGYLNLAHYRGELQGLAAASHILFQKNPLGLSHQESAILVAMLRSPNAKWSKIQARACILDPGDCLDIGHAVIDIQTRDGRDPLAVTLAPHFSYRSATEHQGQEWIETTLDAAVQREARRLAAEQMALLGGQNVHDVAVLVVENQTGEVLAYVGNSPEQSSARNMDGVRVRRQAGSTLKPFLYGAAFEKKILTPNSLLSDIPFELDTGRGIYRPENYDHRFRGSVTVKNALASSMNIPAVRTLSLVSPDDFVRWLKRLGFTEMNSGEDYGVSLALGTADVSLWELVRAYRTFASGGLWSDLKTTPDQGVPPPIRIYSPETAYRIEDILSDREARATTFGLENPLATNFWTAVKTGTSKDMRDNWCVGFSSRYTVGVWVGNFSGEAMWNVSGISGAAPIWVGMMNYLHSKTPSERPLRPATLALDDVPVQPLPVEAFKKILSPTAGSVITWDPDIPASRQRVMFRSSLEEGSAPSFEWRLNGRDLGRADHSLLWALQPGWHHLKLINRRGKTEDEVIFQVRNSPQLREASHQPGGRSGKTSKSL